jgi:hypothetical protein
MFGLTAAAIRASIFGATRDALSSGLEATEIDRRLDCSLAAGIVVTLAVTLVVTLGAIATVFGLG